MSTPVICTASHMRDTRYELHSIHQKANSWMVLCSDRQAAPVQAGGHVAAVRLPELPIHESEFTQEEHDKIAEVLALFERAFERRYNIHAADAPERTKEHVKTLLQKRREIAAVEAAHAEVQQSLEAKRAAAEVEAALLDLQTLEKRVEAERAIAAKQVELEQALAAKHAEGLEALAAKQAEFGAAVAAKQAEIDAMTAGNNADVAAMQANLTPGLGKP